MQILDYLSVCRLSAFMNSSSSVWSFIPICTHLHSQPEWISYLFGICLQCYIGGRRNSFNLVTCLVWNLCPENPQQGVVLSHLSSKTAACWFLLRLSKSLLGHFYPIMFYSQNHFNTVRQERLEESLFASKINCFHQNLPQMHVGVWFERTAPPPWPQALPETNPCPAAPHSVLLSSMEERLQQKEQMFKNVASTSCSYVYLVLLTARFLFLVNKERVSTQARVHWWEQWTWSQRSPRTVPRGFLWPSST